MFAYVHVSCTRETEQALSQLCLSVANTGVRVLVRFSRENESTFYD